MRMAYHGIPHSYPWQALTQVSQAMFQVQNTWGIHHSESSLRQVFAKYASTQTNDDSMSSAEFTSCLTEVGLFPSPLTPSLLDEIFKDINESSDVADDDVDNFDYSEFFLALCYIAHLSYPELSSSDESELSETQAIAIALQFKTKASREEVVAMALGVTENSISQELEDIEKKKAGGNSQNGSGFDFLGYLTCACLRKK